MFSKYMISDHYLVYIHELRGNPVCLLRKFKPSITVVHYGEKIT